MIPGIHFLFISVSSKQPDQSNHGSIYATDAIYAQNDEKSDLEDWVKYNGRFV